MRRKIIEIVYTVWQDEGSLEEAADKILQLIREAIPTPTPVNKNLKDTQFYQEGWNKYRKELLKILK